MASGLRVDQNLGDAAQIVTDEGGNASQLALSSGRVGIGTGDPRATAHIAGTAPADANDGQLRISEAGGNFLLVGRTDAYGFVQSHNREPLSFNPIGNNVGIGTIEPQARVDIVAPAPADANAGQLRIAVRGGNFLLIGRAAEYAFVQSHNREPLALNPLGNDVGIGTAKPSEALEVDGNILATGDIKLQNADVAEEFDVADDPDLEPGDVLVIGEDGHLRRCRDAYDCRVAGVLAGAAGNHPGIILGHDRSRPNRRGVALLGRVMCKLNATAGPVSVGTLLTTSTMPGHAQPVTEPKAAFGAVLGKAMGPLDRGTGLVPVLVALQ